jgi:hypothetical protein
MKVAVQQRCELGREPFAHRECEGLNGVLFASVPDVIGSRLPLGYNGLPLNDL